MYPKATVYRVYNAWEAEGKSKRKKHEPRRDRKVTPRFLAGLIRSVEASPGIPMTVLAKKRNVATLMVAKPAKELCMTSCKLSKWHILTESMKANTVKNGKKLLSNLKCHKSRLVFFSDEKNWTLDRSCNSQLATDRADVLHIYTTKFLASVLTLGVICSNGNVMPPIFFNPKEKVGADRYCEVLCNTVIPWMEAEAQGAPYIFQEDSAPSHMAIKMQKLLRSKKVIFRALNTWPPDSPDLNRMDFFS